MTNKQVALLHLWVSVPLPSAQPPNSLLSDMPIDQGALVRGVQACLGGCFLGERTSDLPKPGLGAQMSPCQDSLHPAY